LLEEPVEDDSELKEELDNIRNMVEAARTKLSKKARAVGLMKRKLDQIPDRAELAQYQRRFVELSNEGMFQDVLFCICRYYTRWCLIHTLMFV